MHCSSCQELIKESVEELPGVKHVVVSIENGTAEIAFEKPLASEAKIRQAIAQLGYKVV